MVSHIFELPSFIELFRFVSRELAGQGNLQRILGLRIFIEFARCLWLVLDLLLTSLSVTFMVSCMWQPRDQHIFYVLSLRQIIRL